ncbi:hypothetical protein [Mycolicibacterium hodleri]|nr:hypothetical protein [Mycolicibacterium hodleri]
MDNRTVQVRHGDDEDAMSFSARWQANERRVGQGAVDEGFIGGGEQ